MNQPSNQPATTKPHYGPLVKLSVLSILLVFYTISLTSTAAGAILEYFQEFGYTSLDIKQIQTIPTLVMIFAVLAVIPLTRTMRKKTVLKIGMILIFVGGITPAFGPNSLPFIFACRAVFGCGYGLLFSLSSSFIVDLFEGDEQRKMMGFKSATGALGGVIFQTIGGILAAIYWKYAFLGFLIALPFILLVWWKCPDPSDLEQGIKAEQPKAPIEKGHLFVIVLGALCITVYSSFMTNMPIVIMTSGLGNPGTVAVVMNCFTVGIFLGAFFYGRTSKIIKFYDIPTACLVFGIVLMILPRAVTLPCYIACAFIFGLAFGTISPGFILAVSRQGVPLAATSAIALYVAGQGLGQFAQPYFLLLTGPLGLNEGWGELAPWVLAGPIMVAIAIGSFIWVTLVTNKKFARSAS